MQLKKISSFILFIFTITCLQAQNTGYTYQGTQNTDSTRITVQTSKPTYNRYWSFGGNVGLSFWNGGTDILLAPKAYYHLTPQLIAGAGLIYNYSDYSSSFYDYKYNSFGGSILGAYRPIRYLQLSAELQTVKTNRTRNNIKDDYWNESLFLGASFVAGNVAFGIQYDALYDAGESPYSSAWTPIISFYF